MLVQSDPPMGGSEETTGGSPPILIDQSLDRSTRYGHKPVSSHRQIDDIDAFPEPAGTRLDIGGIDEPR